MQKIQSLDHKTDYQQENIVETSEGPKNKANQPQDLAQAVCRYYGVEDALGNPTSPRHVGQLDRLASALGYANGAVLHSLQKQWIQGRGYPPRLWLTLMGLGWDGNNNKQQNKTRIAKNTEEKDAVCQQ